MLFRSGMKSRGLGEIKLTDTEYQYIDGENIADYLAEKDIGVIKLDDEDKGGA